MSVRQVESRITAEILDRLGGMLFLASLQVNGKVSITVSAWQPDGPNSREQLARLGAERPRRVRFDRDLRVAARV